MTQDYKARIGKLIRDARKHRGWTQTQLAEVLNTSQSAVNRIEQGHQNITLEMVARIGEALDSEIVTFGTGPTHLRVTGPTTLSGSIDVKSSKNAGVALLCATLLNRGRTTLRKVARIEEVNRLLEVLESLGVRTRWLNDDNDLEIVPPAHLDLAGIDAEAARRTRSVIMFLGPLLHRERASTCRTPGAATSAPAPSSRTWPRCVPSASRSRPPTAATRPQVVPEVSPRSARSCSPSAATPSPRTP